MRKPFIIAFVFALATAAIAGLQDKEWDIDIILGELSVVGVKNDGSGKIVCIKANKDFGTCAAVSITDSGCICE